MLWHSFFWLGLLVLLLIAQFPANAAYRIVKIHGLHLPLAPIKSLSRLIRRRDQLKEQDTVESGDEGNNASNYNGELDLQGRGERRNLAGAAGEGERDGEGAVFFLHNGVFRHIPHEDTWVSFGFTNASDACTQEAEIHSWRTNHGPRAGLWVGHSVCIQDVPASALKPYDLGAPLPLVRKRDNTPDECMRLELLRINILLGGSGEDGLLPASAAQEQSVAIAAAAAAGAVVYSDVELLRNTTYLGIYINPPVVPFHGTLLMATGLAWYLPPTRDPTAETTQSASETLSFRILPLDVMTHATARFLPEDFLQGRTVSVGAKGNVTILGLGRTLAPLDEYFLGQDPRLVPLSDDCIAAVFTNRFTPHISIGLAFLTVNGSARHSSLRNTFPAGDGPGAFVPALSRRFPPNPVFLSSAREHPPYGGHGDPSGNNLVLSHLYPSLLAPSEGGSADSACNAGDPGSADHKNWIPFVVYGGDMQPLTNATAATANNANARSDRDKGKGTGKGKSKGHARLLFVQHIDPLRVVEVDWSTVDAETGHVCTRPVYPSPTDVPATAPAGREAPKQLSGLWAYGVPRGGTPAISLGNGKFLAFFHSVTNIGSWFKTYVMGAIEFEFVVAGEGEGEVTARLTAITPVPIMHKDFYTGRYSQNKNRQIDYVSFPMSLYLETEGNRGNVGVGSQGEGGRGEGDDPRVCVLSFGAQDREGWLAKIPLQRLRKNMVPVPAPAPAPATTTRGRKSRMGKRGRI